MPKALAEVCIFVLAFAVPCVTRADTFGSGAISFNVDFVTIGNPGNAGDIAGDPTHAGAVSYTYKIGKYEISRDMILRLTD